MKSATDISKFMSLVLRHEPHALGITLDGNGWTDFGSFAAAMGAKFGVTRDQIEQVVATSPKQRFVIRDGKIRANQGHSVAVDLALSAKTPPAQLFHGTSASNHESIQAQGLLKGERTHVHLSPDMPTAKIVATRRKGPWIILAVAAGEMAKDGLQFFQSENDVWLVEAVPPRYLSVHETWGNS